MAVQEKTCMASTVLTGTACNGRECKGGSEDVTTCEKKIRWLQLLKEVNCTVTKFLEEQ